MPEVTPATDLDAHADASPGRGPEPVLEPAARALARAASRPHYRHLRGPADGRKALEELQAAGTSLPAVDEEWLAVPGGPTGGVWVRVVRPAGAEGALPVILFIHGAGWVLGSASTHDRLVRELAVGADAAVVFPEYDLSPEVGYPVALEQNYAVARWIVAEGAANDLDGTRLAVVGDSAGGNLGAALTLLAKDRGDVPLLQQVLFCPVTDADFDTGSYHRFATGYVLRRDTMRWFWDQYTTSRVERAQITASPLRATTDQLAGLPPALVVTAEADVLRDEGEAYAARLREAGVAVAAVRVQGALHDFVAVNALRATCGAQAALLLATRALRGALHERRPQAP
ncbi:alpha/beta hydrolase [Streptomyces sp. A1136]|uniref:alpha/beta hydrolase n=1 Tax=Streptomyces sp. A1136 TaxID=2563102 RepID=UPI00109E380C|nr:alpha/beta hydrolase [Streptomyces sp. A1136]THA57918.1 alpha/beta hydrolase [Streptomyces sp. A1136]